MIRQRDPGNAIKVLCKLYIYRSPPSCIWSVDAFVAGTSVLIRETEVDLCLVSVEDSLRHNGELTYAKRRIYKSSQAFRLVDLVQRVNIGSI